MASAKKASITGKLPNLTVFVLITIPSFSVRNVGKYAFIKISGSDY